MEATIRLMSAFIVEALSRPGWPGHDASDSAFAAAGRPSGLWLIRSGCSVAVRIEPVEAMFSAGNS